MTVRELAQALELDCIAAHIGLDREVTSGYVSDLLSDVMANARAGAVWVTSQVHQNVVAVALLLDLAAVVIVGGMALQEDAVEKAEARGIPVLTTRMPAFEVVGRMYSLGIRGEN
ncbi:MAG: DRTGG domain-containing protein [Firmicutes bacterium]|jgi:predicted transcriptional regulator|nr:DRTGG domain-containing protein [Bacillota bacterium]